MDSHLVEGLRNGSWALWGLWWFMALSKTWQLPLMSAWLCELCPIRRDEYPHAYMWMKMSPVNVIFPRKRAGEDIGTPKSTNSTCRISFLSDFSFMWLKTQSLLVVGAHLLCLMQTNGFATIHPKLIFSPLGCANLSLASCLLHLQMADCFESLNFHISLSQSYLAWKPSLSLENYFILIHLFLPYKMNKLNTFHTENPKTLIEKRNFPIRNYFCALTVSGWKPMSAVSVKTYK